MGKKELKAAADHIRKWVKDNPGVTDLAPMYDAYPKSVMGYLSDVLLELKPWEHMSYIPDQAFMCCSKLTNVIMPNKITHIGECAFNGCNNLVSVIMSSNIQSIPEGAFGGCTSLTYIRIGNKVTSIGVGAFEYCLSLKSITIPSSVVSISKGAFSYCDSLESIDYLGTKSQWNEIDLEYNWNIQCAGLQVNCTDGIINL